MGVLAWLPNILITFFPIIGPALEWLLDSFDWVSYKRRLSWRNVTRGIRRLEEEVMRNGFEPDIVVGSGRSGSIVGAWLAGGLANRPFAAIDIRYRRAGGVRVTEVLDHGDIHVSGKKILLVSSEHKSGETSRKEMDYLKDKGAADVKCVALVQYTFSTHDADFYAYRLEREVEFPWRLSPLFRKRS